ncbi:MAG: glycine--tRNA ligase subunit beta, partial [Alphaproteobacteria bacterium]|nr:glycine--tRNA ligase subunit beta [Alphaproteobacteria bacterium]
MPDLLLELFSEEIPARMQKRACADLQKLVTNGLVEAGITYEAAAAFATPRRLCLTVSGVLARSPDLRQERRGPKVGAPDKAIEGFLRGAGVSRDDLVVRDEKKGQIYVALIEKKGRDAGDVVAEVVADSIRNFPWPKSMRWGTGSLRWVRPLHSILCILSDKAGATIVPVDVDGVPCGDTTEGHRFTGSGRFAVTSFADYQAKLKRNNVILDASERADHIWIEAHNMAFAQGLEVVEDKGLLAEVAGLVEWPVVLMGSIDAAYSDLPPEVLQSSMREHQKFFSVRDPKSGAIVKFITVANRNTADNGATILAGNQKVLFARLADAAFFWQNDLRTIKAVGLDGMAKPLENVTFHNKLGSQAERIERIAALAREIAPMVGAKPDLAAEAAQVAKADLASEMVYEFPELQGIIGRYYAKAAGHDDAVAAACQEHYSPLGPTDDVPNAPISVAVALADKIDTLTGFWAIDEKPTGSKDPFALRRAALGVIRLVLDGPHRIELVPLFVSSIHEQGNFEAKAMEVLNTIGEKLSGTDGAEIEIPPRTIDEIKKLANVISEAERSITITENLEKLIDALIELQTAQVMNLLSFFHDRLKVHLRDQGIRHDVIDACLAMPNNDDFVLLVNRATALSDFLKTDDGENLLQGFKRANNILTAEEKKDGVSYEGTPDVKFARDPSENALFAALDTAEAAIKPAIKAEDFAAAMSAMADLRAPIDAFFEAVQINTDHQITRRNRLCLLNR